MKLYKVDLTLSAVGMIKASSEQEAIEIAEKELAKQIMTLDLTNPLVFAGPLASVKRPAAAMSPTVMVTAVDPEAQLVHQS